MKGPSIRTILEIAEAGMKKAAARSFFAASGREKRRRLHWVIVLSAEYERVLAVDLFGTRMMLSDIENVIDGDWEYLRSSERDWAYEKEDEEVRARYGPLHAPWRGLLQAIVVESLQEVGEA